jgi:hypothetical protein
MSGTLRLRTARVTVATDDSDDRRVADNPG